MIRSMTGFGKAEAVFKNHRIEIEIKCQNHRFRDVILKLPKLLQPIEQEIRSAVCGEIQRGRIEVAIFWDRGQSENSFRLEPNFQFLSQYMGVVERIKKELGIPGEISIAELIREPEAISRVPEELEPEEIGPIVLECLVAAIKAANAMREKEGEFLREDFIGRLALINERLGVIEERAKLLPHTYKKRLMERVEALMAGLELDENRIEMEAVLIADRCDITEEIVRAKSHLGQFRELLDSQVPIGRKLEFLIQEIHREVTTMANKAQDSLVSQNCVDIKAELEKLREQSQNIE